MASDFPIIESFRVTRIGCSENDEGNVIASVAGTSTIIIAIGDVKRVAGGHSRAAIIPFGIAHRQKVARVNRHEKLEVDFLGGKFVSEPGKEALKFTACA